jgi:hypothetical protein
MGNITQAPTFLPVNYLVELGAVGSVLTVQAGGAKVAFAAPAASGGGLPGRYTVAQAAGTYNNVTPGAGWPNSDTGARLIATPTGNVIWTGLVAGNDGEMVFLWNNSATYSITLNNNSGSSSAGNQFLISGTSLFIPPIAGAWLVYDATLAYWLQS